MEIRIQGNHRLEGLSFKIDLIVWKYNNIKK